MVSRYLAVTALGGLLLLADDAQADSTSELLRFL